MAENTGRSVRSNRRRELQATHRAWLVDLQKWTGKKLSPIAKGAGLNGTTLTRLANDPEYAGALSQDVIDAIVTRYRVPPPGSVAGDAEAGFGEAEQIPFAEAEADVRPIIEALRAGRDSVTAWRLKSRALELAGILPGDVLAVDLDLSPADGDVVCVQVYDYDRGSAETVFRIYERGILLAASSDPQHRGVYDERDSAVGVMGVVVGSARPWRAARGLRPDTMQQGQNSGSRAQFG